MSETKTITVPRNRQAELKTLYRRFLAASNRVDRLQIKRHESMSNAAQSLLKLMDEIDKISGTQFDWDKTVLMQFERNEIVIQNPTVKPESIQMETEPQTFTGIDRETGQPLCKYQWDSKADLFRLTEISPGTKWTVEMADSAYRFLDQLNENRGNKE